MSTEQKSAVYKKIHDVTASIDLVAKLGQAPSVMGGFRFQAWADVLKAVREACVKHDLIIRPSVTEHRVTPVARQGKADMYYHYVSLAFDIEDVATGESVQCTWSGEGSDTGDKGLQKAITSGTKYFLLKLFMIPDSETVDTDGEAQDSAPVANGRPATQPNTESFDKQEADAYVKGLNLDAKQKMALKTAAGENYVEPMLRAKRAGCESFAEVMSYLVDGEAPK